MTRSRFCALVLAAGFASRLRPLSHHIPKPLLPVCGEPVAGRTLRQLQQAGCKLAALNLHHLPKAIERTFGDSYLGMPLIYSLEEEIQGTLGALHPLRQALGEYDALVLVNGDSLSDWPFRKLMRRHVRSGADVTLLLQKVASTEEFQGGVGLDSTGQVVQLRSARAVGSVVRRAVFAGAHVISPRLLERIEPGRADIVADFYIPHLAEQGTIASCLTACRWHDLGTPRRYLRACLEWRRGRWPLRFFRVGSWLAPSAKVAESSRVQRSVVEADAVVEERASVEETLVLPKARVGRGAAIVHCLVGPGVTVPAGARIEGSMINRAPVGYQPDSGESVLGNLVYTPI